MLIPQKHKGIAMKEVVITHKDGSQEKVYVEDDDDSADKNKFKEAIMLSYVIVGIVGITLTAYVTYLQLKKFKN